MYGIINYKSNGHASIEIDGERYFIFKTKTGKALPGDYVKIELTRHKKKLEAKVIEIVEREQTKFVGIIDKNKDFAFVKPLKSFGYDFYVNKSGNDVNFDDIDDGDKVVVEFTKWRNKDSSPIAKIVERLGKSLDHEVEMNSIILEYGFDTKFPLDALAEADQISDEVIVSKDRTDMRNITTFTIDPKTAKDFDDALSIETIKDGYRIGVHIADVSHYVKEGSAIDKEALKRATSVYLVDRTIPMLPERLSNGLCSLNPNVDRYAFSVMFEMDHNATVKKYWLQNSVINSNKRYAYEDALEVLNGTDDIFSNELDILYNLSLKLRAERSQDTIKVKRKEANFKLDDNGVPLELIFKEASKSTELIEDFMLLANRHVGLEFHKNNNAFIWRTHDTPNLDKLMDLESYLDLVGIDMKIRDTNIKEDLNKILKHVSGTYLHETISTMAMRSMSKAVYTSSNIGHYGLGFETYSHFTSPIRRYPDLIAHRILKRFIKGKIYFYPALEEKCSRCNQKEVSAQRAERDSIKYKQAEYMQKFIGDEFEGRVSFITNNRVFIILDNGIEGSIETKGAKNTQANITYYDGVEIRIGETLNVIIKECNLFKKEITLEIPK